MAPIAVPLKETALGEVETSLITETLPDKAPAVFGEKMMLNVACFPAPIVKGSGMSVIVTPAAVVLACVIVRFDPPPFDIVTDCEAVPPKATEPKLTDAGATEIVAAPDALCVFCVFDAVLGALVIPVQPEMDRIVKSRKTRTATGIALRSIKCACVAYFAAPPKYSFML